MEKEAQKSNFFQWSSGHWIWKVGTIASIIAIPLAFYFHSIGPRNAQLIYTFNPTRTEIVKLGEISRLKIIFDSAEVSSDLSAMQFLFWNCGSREMGKIRDTLTVRTLDRSKIYEARLTKIINPLSKIELDTSKFSIGILKISWEILDSKEGAIVQIIYGSNIGTQFEVSGNFVGQKDFEKVSYNEAKSGRSQWIILPIIGLWMLYLFLLGKLLNKFNLDRFNIRKSTLRNGLAGIIAVIFIGVTAGLALLSGIIINDFFFPYMQAPFDLL